MLQAAVTLLEERRYASDPDGPRWRTLLVAYNQLTKAADKMGQGELSREALRQAESLVAAAPSPSACEPRTAIDVANTHIIRAGVLQSEGDAKQALDQLGSAASYLQQAVAATPDDAALRLRLSDVYQRAARMYFDRTEYDRSHTQYQSATVLLDAGVAREPGNRPLLRRRAVIEAAHARCLLASGDQRSAQSSLEAAVRDFKMIGLRKEDPRNLWMEAIRCWQALGRLYAEQDRAAEAAAAYQQSLAVLEEVRPRMGSNPQYAEFSALSRSELAKLQPHLPAAKSPSQD
jgi:tetratricopeptide (TPR) repeat protein